MSSTIFAIWLVISLLTGLICFLFAKEKGKEKPIHWFFLGFFLNIVAVVIVAFVKRKS